MKKNSDNIIVIVLGVVVFLLFPTLHFFSSHHDDKNASFLLYRPVFSASMILIFYFVNHYFLIPRFYFSRGKQYYILYVLLIFAFLECIEFFFFHYNKQYFPFYEHTHLYHPGNHHSSASSHNGQVIPFHVFDREFILFLLAIIFPIAFQINQRWKKAEQEKINNQLSFLKAQINPHFLFNTLNSVYSLSILEKANRTSDSLIKLSGMMRYVLTESTGDEVLLEQEIKYIRDFFDLQRLRTDQLIEMKLSVEGECGDKKITPMLLIPFVENAFKYGVNPEVLGTIIIQLTITPSDLSFHVFNLKTSRGIRLGDKTGLGISNTRNRLQHLYPDRHQLKITETDKDFTVNLKISFD